MADVKQTFTGDASQLESEYKKLEKSANSMSDKLDWIAKQADRTAEAQGKGSKAAVKGYELAAKEAGRLEVANSRAARAAEELARAGVKGASDRAKHYRQEAELAGKLQQELLKQAGAARNVATESTKATPPLKEQEGLLSLLSSKALGYVGTWMSVSRVIGAAKQRLDELKTSQDAVLQSHVSVAAAQSNLARNLSGVSDSEFTEINKYISQQVRKQGFGGAGDQQSAVATATAGFTSAYNASANNLPGAKQAFEVALQLTRNDPTALKETAAGISDIMKATGETDARKAAGLGITASDIARTDENKDTFKMIARAASTGANLAPEDRKEQARKAAAFAAALSTEIPDPEGDISETAVAATLNFIDKTFEEGYKMKVGTHEIPIRPSDPKDLEKRLDAINSSRGLKSYVIENAPFGRAKTEAMLKSMYRGERMRTKFNEALGKVDYSGEATTAAIRRGSEGTPQLATATEENRQRALEATRDLDDTTAASYGTSDRTLDTFLARTNRSINFADWATGPLFRHGQYLTSRDAKEFQRRAIQQRLANMQTTLRQIGSDSNEQNPRRKTVEEDIAEAKIRLRDLDGEGGMRPKATREEGPPSPLMAPALTEEQKKTNDLLGSILQFLMGNPDRAPGVAPAARGDRGVNREK